ncbi:MAG: ASKHA domain-containing protein [Anaerocolumna sp.]
MNITVKSKTDSYIVRCKKGQSVMEALKENDTYVNAICGGRGTCGKCKIRLLSGNVTPTKEDMKIFTSEELDQGYLLACKAYPSDDCAISLEFNDEEDFYVVTDYENVNLTQREIKEGTYVVGIDIGTTTIAMQLMDMTKGVVIDTYTAINKQRAYGGDVISRIEASNSGQSEALKESIQMDLKKGIKAFVKKNRVVISEITMAGNTTMIHLLMGYSCKGLGVFPYTPVNIRTIQTTYEQLLGDQEYGMPITIFPGISTYVGGDIVAGLFCCEFHQKEEISVLIDLGTNGEMVIGNKDRILVTSTAAGPAFEGGNITYGTGSVPGAISNVSILNGEVTIKTIGDKPPIGICGTGVIETTLELLKEELIDETGLLTKEYFDEGYVLASSEADEKIIFTQKDMREIQLAKAAVRAGLETLLLRYGVTYDQVSNVYLAGGFGYKVDIEKAIGIGLIPEAFRGKIKTIGNSSLYGSLKYMERNTIEDGVVSKATKELAHMIEVSQELTLSNDTHFNDLYLKHMFFNVE